mmetsp:Transcript_28857/g.70733  ORF Transcript_28857/g.70733 Transcript_28857/m.70733 type:complete len:202 (+) Transcript_28857:98-703(+)
MIKDDRSLFDTDWSPPLSSIVWSCSSGSKWFLLILAGLKSPPFSWQSFPSLFWVAATVAVSRSKGLCSMSALVSFLQSINSFGRVVIWLPLRLRFIMLVKNPTSGGIPSMTLLLRSRVLSDAQTKRLGESRLILFPAITRLTSPVAYTLSGGTSSSLFPLAFKLARLVHPLSPSIYPSLFPATLRLRKCGCSFAIMGMVLI